MNKNNLEFNESEKTSLEKDIKEMEKIVDLNGVKLLERNNIKKSNKFYDIIKDESESILFIKMNEDGFKNYSYYAKKIMESKSDNQSRKYFRKLLFHHLKQE